LREEISDILRREFKDPRLGFVTVIDAELTPDLQYAKVYVSVLGTEAEQDENIKVLKHAEHFIRKAFGKRVRMKTLPQIEFVLDKSGERGVRILELLEEIKRDEEE